jgi:hypothetical protein
MRRSLLIKKNKNMVNLQDDIYTWMPLILNMNRVGGQNGTAIPRWRASKHHAYGRKLKQVGLGSWEHG